MKCANCGEKDMKPYYKYSGKVYCLSCLEDYYHDELAEIYFDKFLEEECKEMKND